MERAKIADDAIAGVDADANPDRKKDPVGRLRPPEVVELNEFAAHRLNRILDMIGIITERKGTIDRYIGDCIMAFWNPRLATGPRFASNRAARPRGIRA